jgi:chemotaxis protein methyltransferase CheR
MNSLIDSLVMSEDQFNHISTLVRNVAGINLHDGKKQLVKARLSKILRKLEISDFDDYIKHLSMDSSGLQLTGMLDALSTNLTYFFRELRHFEYLKETVLPAIIQRNIASRKLRLWSAGCSSGEEPYSLAITLLECAKKLEGWDLGILATDLSTRVLAKARQGIYQPDRFREMPKQYLPTYFNLIQTRPMRLHEVSPQVRHLVKFANLNLMSAWPMRGPFDVIFCRNVMIYFDKETQSRLIERYWDMLCPGGYLFVGHSESLSGIDHQFNYIQPAVYRKA